MDFTVNMFAQSHGHHRNREMCKIRNGYFYRHNLLPIVYTDGVKEMAEACGAYWLIDLVISHQLSKRVQGELFQLWELKRVKNDAFCIVATDGNNNQVASQEIPFSDFRHDEATLWLVDGCLMLPKKY